jgi:hypothetical protein
MNGVPAQLSAAGPLECGAQGYIWSKFNGLYVSTEVGYPAGEKGLLRARSATVGPWELYQICAPKASGEPRYLWSDGAAKWVTAEDGSTGEWYGAMRARSNSIGAWEEYGFIGHTFINGSNGRWVAGEFGYPYGTRFYGMLRDRSEGVGPWEEWYF